MATVLRFVEPTTNVERLNLNDPAGFHLVRGGINLGTVNVDATWLSQPPFPGSIPAGFHRPNVEMVLRLMLAPQPTWAAAVALWGKLATELDRKTNAIEFKPDGSVSSYFIDTFKSPIPSLFRGQEAPSAEMYKGDTEPVELLIYRKPNLRGAGTFI